MSIKIFTMTHKSFETIKDPMYIPLQVGRAKSVDLGYLGDDSGDSISDQNCYYSELTGIYWIWKNYHEADYVGVCHYRRYLINDQGKLYKEAEFLNILKEYDIITTKTLELNFSYFEGYGKNHNQKDLIETGNVIREIYPEYYPVFQEIVNSTGTYFGNIMVTSKPLFDEYAQWLFNIFFQVQKRVDIDDYDDYHKRVFGFISEILLKVWVTAKNLKVYEAMVGMVGEKYETREMKLRLAEFFREKDISGAKKYFLEVQGKRPDVLMEASDTTGELKLAMQVIATSDLEYQFTNTSILNEISEFQQLMQHFTQLNKSVEHFRMERVINQDIIFIQDKKVSYLAIEIAVKILCTGGESSIATLLSIAKSIANSMDSPETREKKIRLLNRCLEYDSDCEEAKTLLENQ